MFIMGREWSDESKGELLLKVYDDGVGNMKNYRDVKWFGRLCVYLSAYKQL